MKRFMERPGKLLCRHRQIDGEERIAENILSIYLGGNDERLVQARDQGCTLRQGEVDDVKAIPSRQVLGRNDWHTLVVDTHQDWHDHILAAHSLNVGDGRRIRLPEPGDNHVVVEPEDRRIILGNGAAILATDDVAVDVSVRSGKVVDAR